jgi:hypothetical protein
LTEGFRKQHQIARIGVAMNQRWQLAHITAISAAMSYVTAPPPPGLQSDASDALQ